MSTIHNPVNISVGPSEEEQMQDFPNATLQLSPLGRVAYSIATDLTIDTENLEEAVMQITELLRRAAQGIPEISFTVEIGSG